MHFVSQSIGTSIPDIEGTFQLYWHVFGKQCCKPLSRPLPDAGREFSNTLAVESVFKKSLLQLLPFRHSEAKRGISGSNWARASSPTSAQQLCRIDVGLFRMTVAATGHR